LAAGGGALWYLAPKLSPILGLTPRHGESADAKSPDVLERQLARDKVRRLEVRAGGEPVILEKGASGTWALPGKWPTRKAEAEELVTLITSLHSRFQVVPLTAEMDLKPFGLDPSQKPVTVIVDSGSEQPRLVFGEPEHAEGGPFATPTYVRVNDKPEVARLAPDLLPILKRSREFYQRRQLFPDVERLRFGSAAPPASPFGSPPAADSGGPTLIPKAREIVLESPLGKVALRRIGEVPKSEELLAVRSEPMLLAEQWEIVEPFKDRPDPERIKALLAAVPDLWVERFIASDDPVLARTPTPSAAGGWEGIFSWLKGSRGPADQPGRGTGLEHPDRTLRVTLAGGDTVVLRIGNVSQVKERPGQPMPPLRPGMPPMPPMPIREEHRYAQLEGQSQVFEIKADKINDLFVSASTLRDEKLARFKAGDLTKVEIKQTGSNIVLTKEKDERKLDKWRVVQPMQALAENEKVSELVDKLSGLDARVPDVIDNPNLKETGFDPATGIAISLSLDEEIPGPGEEKTKRQRTVVFTFGKHDDKAKKVNVRVAGRDRVSVVNEDILKLAERPALAYRGRRVLDFDTTAVASIEVHNEKEQFRLEHANDEWKLTAPAKAPADKNKAGDLAFDLSRLEATEYVNDAPKPEDLAKAGLDKPVMTATVSFTDPAKAPETISVGKQREGKPDYFAKLSTGTSIFAVRKDVRDKFEQKSLDFRPTHLWTLTPNEITGLKLTRTDGSYEIKKDGFEWKIAGPFDAAASQIQVQPILDALANPKVTGYQAHTAANPAEFGFDKPALQVSFAAAEKPKEGEKETTRERTLIVGKAVEGKPELYAKLADDPAVFRIPDATKANLDKPALDLLDRRLLTLDSRQISKIERVGSAAMMATKEAKEWKISSGATSFPADKPSLDAVLRTWEFLSAEKYADFGPKADWSKYGLNPPADTVTVTLSADAGAKPVTHTLKLGKEEGGGRYARLDDGPGVVVLTPAVVHELARSHLDFVDRSLLNFDDAELQAVRRSMKNSDLEIVKKNTWKITKPTEQAADEQALDEWAKQWSKLRADRVAAYAATELKPFGLDAPVAVVTFVLPEKDGKPVQHVLKMGAPADAKQPEGDRFAMVEGSKVVGVLPRAEAKRLLADPIQFRDRTLVRRLAEPDRVVLERSDRTGANQAVFTKVDGTWKLTSPVTAEAEHSDMEDFLNALYKLRADELIAEKPPAEKLKEFGLDKPEATWHFYASDKEILGLQVGKRDATGQRCYAKLLGGDIVFLLEPQVTGRATAEYRKRSLWSGFDAAQVDMLTISGESGNFVLRKNAGAWQLDGKPDQRVNQDVVTETLGALANLKVERFVRDKDAPLDVYGLGKPKRIIVARTGGGMTQTLDLGNAEGGSKRLYATLPGQTAVFVLSEADSAKLDRDLKAFIGGK
jgi:hypothetical protein